jgi:protein-S-isoprenylcysteine O-methyltransferase Ste14
MNNSETAALLAYFLLFFAAAFLWPTWRLWRCERTNALVLPHDDSAHGVIATWFRLLIASTFLLLVALAAGLPAHALGHLDWLEQPATAAVGWLLLLVSLVWIVLAQRQMGRSWRIGIDTGTQPPLVREGLFRRSRNPIFLGMRLNLAGLFLVLPNAATLALVLLAEALIQVQVRLEEAHLSATFGETYAQYRRAAPRWI